MDKNLLRMAAALAAELELTEPLMDQPEPTQDWPGDEDEPLYCERPSLVRLSGQAADGGKLDDSGEETFAVLTGKHRGHVLRVSTAKYNCGAFSEEMRCSCGQAYANAMDGCWQWGHQREEGGDVALRDMWSGNIAAMCDADWPYRAAALAVALRHKAIGFGEFKRALDT